MSSTEPKTSDGLLPQLGIMAVVSCVLFGLYWWVVRPVENKVLQPESPPQNAPSPMMGPVAGMRSAAPAENNAEQEAKIEAVMKAMDPKFQALQGVMQAMMSGEKEPTPEMQKVGMLTMQAMQYGQAVRMLGMTNSPRAQRRLESGLAILADLLDEAYEEAQQAGLLADELPHHEVSD